MLSADFLVRLLLCLIAPDGRAQSIHRPSIILAPEVFAKREVTLLSGMITEDAEKGFRIIS